MTTAHRPTFDHAKGKANSNKTHIVHKRFLPAHTQLKYRHAIINDRDDEYETAPVVGYTKAKKSLEEMKMELVSKEMDHFSKQGKGEYKDRYLLDLGAGAGEGQGAVQGAGAVQLAIEGADIDTKTSGSTDGVSRVAEGTETNQNETFEERVKRIKEETKDIDASSSESEGDDSENDSDSEEEEEGEDEDETELLLKELSRLKKIKEENNKLVEREEKVEEFIMKEAAASAAAVTASLDSVEDQDQDQGVKRSWRNETVFSNRSQKRGKFTDGNANANANAKAKGYVNDMLRDQYHKKFMDKFIK